MILVTGATGTVGSFVVRELLDRSAEFRATVHDRPLEREGVETQRIDFDRPESLSLAVEGVQSVFLVLPMTVDERSMIDAARNVIVAARRADVERIVKLSAYRAGDEGYAHARWHRKVEREIERSGVAWTFLRPNAFMQSLLDEWGESIRNGDVFFHPVEGGYAPIDARDVGRVAAHVLTEPGHDGTAYELTGPETLTHKEVAETLTRVLGRPIRYVRIGDEDYRQTLLASGLSEEMAAASVDANRYVRSVPNTVTSSVRDVTGREPVSFEEFCRDRAAALAATS